MAFAARRARRRRAARNRRRPDGLCGEESLKSVPIELLVLLRDESYITEDAKETLSKGGVRRTGVDDGHTRRMSLLVAFHHRSGELQLGHRVEIRHLEADHDDVVRLMQGLHRTDPDLAQTGNCVKLFVGS